MSSKQETERWEKSEIWYASQLPPSMRNDVEAAMLKADAEEAERGYTDEQLSEALKRTPGRPLAVGSTPASNVIRVRLDDERDAKLERYMRKHHMSRSNAVRTLLDKALAEI